MRRLISTIALLLVALLALSGAASASSGSTAPVGSGLPLAAPPSQTFVPAGFSASARQAMEAAEATPAMRAIHARHHPLLVNPFIWTGKGPSWFIEFVYGGKLLAEAVVSPRGHVDHVWTGPLAQAVWARGDFATLFGSIWVVGPFSILFLIPFLHPRRLRRLVHFDALVLLSFLVSYALFAHAHLTPAVWLVYPPLLYLAARMLWLGARRSTGGGLSPFLSERALGIGLAVILVARIVLSLTNHEVIDVGYASVIGAHRIVAGHSLYYAAAAHGDTYGPIAYLAYVPFELLAPWRGSWDYLLSAHLASVFFDLVTVAGLVVLGRRLLAGSDGRRLGLALGWAWAACPFTLLALLMHSNDGLVAMLSVLGLVAFSSPAGRGALLGLAAAAKFSPAALLPLFASGRARGWKSGLVCAATFLAVVVAAVAVYLPPGGLREFYDHTIGFQLSRTDIFSAWALDPGLGVVKIVFEVAAGALALAVAVTRRERSLVQVSALAAAVTIAVQIPAIHWFYYYIVWFMPFVLVALLAPPLTRRPARAPEAPARGEAGDLDREPMLAGV